MNLPTKHIIWKRIRVLLIIITLIVLSRIADFIPNAVELPKWIYICGEPDNLQDKYFDLGIILFNSQLALIAIYIALVGLLSQLSESSERYLGVKYRQVIVSSNLLKLSLIDITFVLLFSMALSYYYLTRNLINSILILSVFSIFASLFLLKRYILLFLGKDSIRYEIIEGIKNQIMQNIQLENAEINRIWFNANRNQSRN